MDNVSKSSADKACGAVKCLLFRKIKNRMGLPVRIYRDWRFWCSLAIIALLAAIHQLLEVSVLKPVIGDFLFLPVSLYWVPVIYCAWNFGFPGSLAAALFALLVSIPNFIFTDSSSSRAWEASQVFIMVTVSAFIGFLVDQKRRENERAKLFAEHSLHIQEEERRRISRDLHDNTIQSLVFACRQIDHLRYFNPEIPAAVSDELLLLRKSLEQTVNELREFTRTLRPYILDDLGVANAVRQMLNDTTDRSGINTSLIISGPDMHLEPEYQESLYRIVLEAVRNAEKHSRGTQFTVKIDYSIDKIYLEMTDNGIGFEIPANFSHFGAEGEFGVMGMMEHAEVLGGHFNIQSSPGKGTRITVQIPFNRRTNIDFSLTNRI